MSVATFFSSKSILITGASSGIGEELALQLAAAGAHLTLTARRRELLDALAQKISAAGHETPLVVSADVTRDGDLEHAVSESLRAFNKLDIVIANAGFRAVGPPANPITAELALEGVKLTLISPGFVASNIRRIDNRGTFHSDAKEPIPEWLVMPTQTAGPQILRAIAKGKREAIITGHGKALVVIERFAPWIIRAAGRRMAANRGGYRTEPNA